MHLIRLKKKEVCQLSPRLAKMRLQMLSFPNIRVEYKPVSLILADTLIRSCPSGNDVDSSSDPMPAVCSNVFASSVAQESFQLDSTNDEELSVVSIRA